MKKLQVIFVSAFILIILSGSVLTAVLPQREFSENENRRLMTSAGASKNVMSGEFERDLEELLSDQFFLREGATALETAVKRLAGQRELNGVYLGRERLFQKYTDADVDLRAARRYAQRLKDLGGEFSEMPVFIMPVPSAGLMLGGLLPRGAAMYDADALYGIYEGAGKLIDLREKLTDAGDYYLTDHHWTAAGAYKAYLAFSLARGRTPASFESFEPRLFSGEFQGSLSSKALYFGAGPDSLYTVSVPDGISVTADGKKTPFYHEEFRDKKDKYSVFLGGNYGTVVIENEDAEGGTLLMLKDSFANSFVPYIIPEYKKIVLIDERYAAFSLSELVREYGADEVLVLKELCAK